MCGKRADVRARSTYAIAIVILSVCLSVCRTGDPGLNCLMYRHMLCTVSLVFKAKFRSPAGKVTAGLLESNAILLHTRFMTGFMSPEGVQTLRTQDTSDPRHFGRSVCTPTRGLTAKKPESALCLTLVIEYRITLLFYLSTL